MTAKRNVYWHPLRVALLLASPGCIIAVATALTRLVPRNLVLWLLIDLFVIYLLLCGVAALIWGVVFTVTRRFSWTTVGDRHSAWLFWTLTLGGFALGMFVLRTWDYL